MDTAYKTHRLPDSLPTSQDTSPTAHFAYGHCTNSRLAILTAVTAVLTAAISTAIVLFLLSMCNCISA